MYGPKGWVNWILIGGCTLSILAFARPLYCDPSREGKVTTEQARHDTKPKEEPGEDTPRRSIQMNEIQIRGEVEKPKAMFIIPRATTDYSSEEDVRDFSKEILAPMDMDRIEGMGRYSESMR